MAKKKKELHPTMAEISFMEPVRGLSPKDTRNRMELEYIRGASVKELAEKYGLAESTVNIYRSKYKWNKYRKEFRSAVKETKREVTSQVYAGFKAEINIKYHSAWSRLMEVVEMMLDDPKTHLFHDDGKVRIGALDMLANILGKAQAGQEKANGNIPPEVAMKLSIEMEKLNILREQKVEGANAEIVKDNFIDALNSAASNVWADFNVGTVKASMEKQVKFAEKIATDDDDNALAE